MALGDKLPVVMGKEKAVANGVATLDSDGKLAEEQRPTTDPAPTQDSDNPVQSGGVYTALAGKADLTLSNLSNYQKALRNIGGRPNSNLLDNAYFKGGGSQQEGGQFPINQRGQTSYASGNVIDRWKLSGNGGQSLIIDTDGITLTSTAEYGLYFDQPLEQSVVDACLGKTVTVSVISVGQNTANLSLNLYVDSAWTDYMGIQEGINSKQFAIPPTANSFYFNFGAGAAGTCKLSAAKLELGSHQTLAYQDEDGNWQLFETPDYGEELAKCQRYYLPIDTRGKFPAVFSSPSTTLQVFVPTPVTMRVNPTVQGITSISARVYSGAANSQSLSVSQALLTEAGVLITFSVTWPSTLNPYSCAIVVFGGDGALSAEL